MAEDVRQWLRDIGCEHYHPIFVQNGFSTVFSLSKIDDSMLDRMAIINPSHRQAILSKAQGGGGGGGVTDDFDSLLGDLTSVIADLESISVPQPGPITTLPTNTLLMESPRHVPKSVGATASASSSGSSTPLGGGTPYGSLNRQEKKPVQGYHIEESIKEQDFDLDALLDDLCEFDPMKEAQAKQPTPPPTKPKPSPQKQKTPPPPPQRVSSAKPPPPAEDQKPNGVAPQQVPQPTNTNPPGQSPSIERPVHFTDGEPEFTTNPSPGTEGSVTVIQEPKIIGASEEITKEEVEKRLEDKSKELRSDPSLTEDEIASKMKEEKMRIALEKMKVASKRKVVIKVFNNDGSNKTVVVEEGMTAAIVCYLLVSKNHFEESPNWTVIERLGDVGLERELEDHELVEQIYTHWARDSNNQFLFKRHETKYEIFTDPTKYFPMLLTNTLIGGKDKKNAADKARKILVQEYFTSALRVPEIEGYLHLKDGYKNKWKKIYVILRASGLYQTLKGKSKTARNLQLLVQFDECDVYRGLNFKKLLKAPTDHCFALRPIPDQMVPGAKDIKVFCSDSVDEYISWYAGIRLAKHGHALYDNYYKAHLKQFKLEGTEEGQQAEQVQQTIEERAYTLSGMRLEKHLDKKREVYQKEKEAREAQENLIRRNTWADPGASEEPAEVPPKAPPKVAPRPQRSYDEPPQQPPPPEPRLDDLTRYPWYHGAIPREEAVRRLEQMGSRDGNYLVRDSSSVANSYVLTMFAKSVPKNFQIMPYEAPGSQIVFRIDDGPAFQNVEQVLQHYQNVADRLPCKLTDFCPRPPTRMTEC